MGADRIATAALVLALLAAGCSGGGADEADLERARAFDRHPLYWVGDRFEGHDLEHVEASGEFVTIVYGTCEPTGSDGGCAPPLQLQIQPLCAHLEAVARAPVWRRRTIRGAPVGAIGGAPVLFSRAVQVKVYRGEGSEPGAELRALRSLRSLNDVEPVLDEEEPIPPAPRAVLEREEVCAG